MVWARHVRFWVSLVTHRAHPSQKRITRTFRMPCLSDGRRLSARSSMQPPHTKLVRCRA